MVTAVEIALALPTFNNLARPRLPRKSRDAQSKNASGPTRAVPDA